MIRIEMDLVKRYRSMLKYRQIPENEHGFYLKWLRYYLDFCHRYEFNALSNKSLSFFIDKLRSKKQAKVQQAVNAIHLFYAMDAPTREKNNSLLFFYRHISRKEFGKIDGVVRAKKKLSIPVVLSKDEINRIIAELKYPYDLVVKMLYGCGLRLSECLNLGVNNFNFDAGIVTIHDGKGKKDRRLPIPDLLKEELHDHLNRIAYLHEMDLAENYDGGLHV